MADARAFRFADMGEEILVGDRFELTTVGIDIGSATTHLVFSRLVFERREGRYRAVGEEIVYRSPILLTPYAGQDLIDRVALGRFFAEQYRTAGLRREQVDAGALILTGVALARRNAQAIGEIFAEEGGRFVSVSAGDHLEAIIAAHGSGAVALSRREEPILHIDIGGGTTKFALCVSGAVQQVAAIDIGTRLVVRDGSSQVVRLEPAGRLLAQETVGDLAVGAPLDQRAIDDLAQRMAKIIGAVVQGRGRTGLAARLWRTAPLDLPQPATQVMLSGGVAEYFWGAQTEDFGDLGPALATNLQATLRRHGLRVLPCPQGIRSTVIGASQYTVQVSGATIYISADAALPLRNVPVITPDLDLSPDRIDPEQVREQVVRSLERLDLERRQGPLAVCIRWQGSASYGRLEGLCAGLRQSLEARQRGENTLVVVCDHDVGGLIGIHLHDELGFAAPVVALDGIELRELDFIDVGSVVEGSGALPVTIKSLRFPGSGGDVVAPASGGSGEDSDDKSE